MSNTWKIVCSIVLVGVIIMGAVWILRYYAEPSEVVNNNLQIEEDKPERPSVEEKNPEEHEISKYVQMYLMLFDDIMSFDTGLNQGDFLSIDVTSLDKEYANEELKETTQVFFIDETDIADIVDYMKKYNDVIKTNSIEELEEQGLFHRENVFSYSDGPILYVSDIKILGEDHFEIHLVKYVSALAANFNTYEVQYEDGKWTFEITASAIS